MPHNRLRFRRGSRRHWERAQGLVEFAVILPLFAFFLGMVIDGGLVMGRYNNITNAAKEGARLGAVGASQSDIITRVEQQAHGGLDSAVTDCAAYASSQTAICVQWIDGASVNGGPSPGPGEVGSSVRVKAKYHYTPLTPVLRQVGGWEVEVCAVQRLEQPVDSPPSTSSGTSCSSG
jgi:Flp pilus assembly protein TadG